MRKNRIREIRDLKALKLESVAETAGISPGYLSRIERGERGLSLRQAEKIARALGASTSDVLGLANNNGHSTPGFADDCVPYEAKDNDPFQRLPGPNEYLWVCETNVLDKINVLPGDVMIVNDSQARRDKLQPLEVVQVAFHPAGEPERAIRLLRQFVPPTLLITNCSTGNMPSIDLDEDDAQIVGVVTSVHRNFAARS